MAEQDPEQNRFSRRLRRYGQVGGNIGGVAARMATKRLFGSEGQADRNAMDLAAALGGLKGPIMKVAQLLSTIPDALPPEYAEELAKLQASAPPMGWSFVKRRMTAELGEAWQSHFAAFDREPAAAASLGQVHKAILKSGERVACKLQYPDMQSAVEADLRQLGWAFSVHRRMRPPVDTSEIFIEIGDRIREELDYRHEARNLDLYRLILAETDDVRVPERYDVLCTKRLMTMSWLTGRPMLDFKSASLPERNHLAKAMFTAWWLPFARYGVIHGDPHLGNYTVFEEAGAPAGVNLLDFGCIRIFPGSFTQGVVDLYKGLLHDREDQIVSAYELWGFKGLTRDVIEILNTWARFIYGPILDNRVRTVADGISPGAYGRQEAFSVAKALKEKGPVTVPREFVFMDRAAIGLGAVFLHLQAELNFYELFNEAIADYSAEQVAARQQAALNAVGHAVAA